MKLIRTVPKHFKLLEALGLMMLLFAWGADWYSVHRWNDIESGYWRFIETFHGATEKTGNEVGQKLQFAISRAIEGTKIDYSRPDAAYIVAWHSAEVRHLWLSSAGNRFLRADITMREIQKTSNENSLSTDIDVNTLNLLREEARDSLAALIDPTKGPLDKQIPSEKDVTPYEANKIDSKVSAFNAATVQPINKVGQAIKAAKNRASGIYRIIFALGSILVVLAKFLEWGNTVIPSQGNSVKNTDGTANENQQANTDSDQLIEQEQGTRKGEGVNADDQNVVPVAKPFNSLLEP